MEKMQRGGGGARAKSVPGMGRTRTTKRVRGVAGEAFKSRGRGKSKLFGVRGENPFGRKKYQFGGASEKVKDFAKKAAGSPQKMGESIKKLGSAAKKAIKKKFPNAKKLY